MNERGAGIFDNYDDDDLMSRDDVWWWEHQFNFMRSLQPEQSEEAYMERMALNQQNMAVDTGVNSTLATESIGSTPVLWDELRPTPKAALDRYTTYERGEKFSWIDFIMEDEEYEETRAWLESRFEKTKAFVIEQVKLREALGEEGPGVHDGFAGCYNWTDDQWNIMREGAIESAIGQLEHQRRYQSNDLKMSHLHCKDEEKVMEIVAFHGVPEGTRGHEHVRQMLDVLKANPKWPFKDKLAYLRTQRRMAIRFFNEPADDSNYTRFVWPFLQGVEALKKIVYPDGDEKEEFWGYEAHPYVKNLKARGKYDDKFNARNQPQFLERGGKDGVHR